MRLRPRTTPEDLRKMDAAREGKRDTFAFPYWLECIEERPKSIRVQDANGNKRWVPQSVIHDDSEVYRLNTTGRLIVAHWWAEKEGLTK